MEQKFYASNLTSTDFREGHGFIVDISTVQLLESYTILGRYNTTKGLGGLSCGFPKRDQINRIKSSSLIIHVSLIYITS